MTRSGEGFFLGGGAGADVRERVREKEVGGDDGDDDGEDDASLLFFFRSPSARKLPSPPNQSIALTI